MAEFRFIIFLNHNHEVLLETAKQNGGGIWNVASLSSSSCMALHASSLSFSLPRFHRFFRLLGLIPLIPVTNTSG